MHLVGLYTYNTDPLKIQIRLHNIQKLSPYLAENKYQIDYEEQQVNFVQRRTRRLLRDSYDTYN